MMELIPRCLPGVFTSALHVLCTPTCLAFQPLPVYQILQHFFSLLRLAFLQRKIEGWEGGCLGRREGSLAANPGAASRAGEHPVAASSGPNPIVESSPCTPCGLPFPRPFLLCSLAGSKWNLSQRLWYPASLTSQVGKLRSSDLPHIPQQVGEGAATGPSRGCSQVRWCSELLPARLSVPHSQPHSKASAPS